MRIMVCSTNLTRIIARTAGPLAFLSIVAGIIVFIYYFWLALPMGAGPAGPSVPKEPFTTVWTERPVILLGIGGNITNGYGAPKGKAFFDWLYANPPDEYPDMQGICLKSVLPKLKCFNVSISGTNSIQHEKVEVQSLQPFPKEIFGIVVMTTGGYDLHHWHGKKSPEEGAVYGATLEQAKPWITNFEQRLEQMIENITKLFPGGCHVFLGTIYDPSDGGNNPWWTGLRPWKDSAEIIDAYNEIIRQHGEKHSNVTVVDIHKAFLGHGVRCAQFWRATYHPEDPHYWYYGNIEDPNERGYDAIRRLFLLKILEVLGTSPPPLQTTP
ncbi:MAG TPA: SGNH/GDSL hydrolase family protein [Candidatus Hydrogenedentes bacterium]|nr:SGNH/GDSL hydrolase family protein [Candidatus Hydrogenedentota bacterium]